MTRGTSGSGARAARTRQVVLAAVVAILLAAPVAAHAVTPSEPARLAGSNVITATGSSTTTVRIPRSASLIVDGAAHSPDVEVASASGRLAGFVLTALDRPDRLQARTLLVWQIGSCTQRGCHPTAPYAAYEYVSPTNDMPVRKLGDGTQQVTLEAGDYTIRAVTDGAPVRMTLRLRGLAGAARVDLTRPQRLVLRTDSSPPGVLGVEPLRNVQVAQTFKSARGLMFSVEFMQYEPHVRSVQGSCYYQGENKPPAGKYYPGCPNSEAEFMFMTGYPTLHYYGMTYGGAIGLVPGKWTSGFYLAGAGGKSSFTVVSLSMELD